MSENKSNVPNPNSKFFEIITREEIIASVAKYDNKCGQVDFNNSYTINKLMERLKLFK